MDVFFRINFIVKKNIIKLRYNDLISTILLGSTKANCQQHSQILHSPLFGVPRG